MRDEYIVHGVYILLILFVALFTYEFTKDTPNHLSVKVLGQDAICDASLWQHVYHGRFATASDRLKPLQKCITVTGTIVNAVAEKDGDFHIRVRLDPKFSSLLNGKNISGQHGYLVVEPVCENPISQKDTFKEGVCKGFSQHVYTPDMKGKHVQISGAYVTDMEHGWNEIHPVTSITKI